MDRPIRVLIVDDAALMRHRLRSIIAGTAGFEVAGVAASGEECLAQLATLQPDVITLDVWMPEMDGLATLGRIMQQRPTPVVMVSSLTEAGAQTTLDALALGAVDYLTKPSSFSDPSSNFADDLIGKLSIAAQARVRAPRPITSLPHRVTPAWPVEPPSTRAARGALPSVPMQPAVTPTPSAHGGGSAVGLRPIQRSLGHALVVIGSSTGGPQMLDRLFGDLAESLPAAFLVVQHMPPLFTQSLAARLNRQTTMQVREVEEGDYLAEGLVLVAKGGSHVTLGPDQRLHLDQSAPVHSVRPAVDRTLLSVAEQWHGRCLTVILTGMGVDGADGARAVRLKGARVVAQDEHTSVVYGMPRAVVEAGLASAVLPIDAIAPEIKHWAASGKTAGLSQRTSSLVGRQPAPGAPPETSPLAPISHRERRHLVS